MDVQLGFVAGMQQDISPVKRDKNSYYEALNARVVTAEGETTGSITNDLGNEILFKVPKMGVAVEISNIKSLSTFISIKIDSAFSVQCPTINPDETTADAMYRALLANANIVAWISANKLYIKNNRDSIKIVIYDYGAGNYINVYSGTKRVLSKGDIETPRIVGYTQMRDSLILFTTIPSTGSGQIWKLDYNHEARDIYNLDVDKYLQPYYHLKYVELLDLDYQQRVGEIITKYNNPSFGKIYWPNGDTLRHLNILDADSLGTPLGFTELLPNVTISTPKFVSVIEGGSFKVGMVQYGYQLYNYGGAETVVSPTTPLIHLVATNASDADTSQYKGSVIETSANKSVNILIDNIDTKFEYIKVWSVFYGSKGNPVINLVVEDKVQGTTYTFTDSNNVSLDTLTQAEFSSIGGTVFSPKTLTTKDNYLIAANITEDTFDIDEELGYYWDARVYRFAASSDNFKIDDNVDTYSNISTVDQEANCRTLEADYSTYKYKRLSSTLGGSGVNIEYEFVYNTLNMGVAETTTNRAESKALYYTGYGYPYSDLTTYTDYSSPYNSAYMATYQVGEVYRFGIEFFDNKGRRSFVKWIGDIRIPTYYENSTKLCRENGGVVETDIIGIKFHLFSIPSKDGVQYKYRIVRVPREKQDCRVVSMAVIRGIDVFSSETVEKVGYINEGTDGSDEFSFEYPLTQYTHAENVQIAVSPEICFNNTEYSLDNLTGCTQEVIGIVTLNSALTYLLGESDFGVDLGASTIKYGIAKYSGFSATSITSNSTAVAYSVSDSIQLPIGWDTTVGLNGISFNFNNSTKPIIDIIGDVNYKGYLARGGKGIYYTNNTPYDNLIEPLTDRYVILFLKNTDYSRYGGTTYAARSRNAYIPCSYPTSYHTSQVFFGDTYNVMFDYQSSTTASNVVAEDIYSASTVMFPIQTRINTTLRHDTCFTRSTLNSQRWKLQESTSTGVSMFNNPTSGEDVGDYPSTYTNLYLINSVYNMENTTVRGFSKPLNFVSNTEVDYRILSSQPSIANESVDSWTKFYPNDYIDLNSEYGPINKVLINNNILISLQDNGLAAVAFKDRQLLQDELQGQLVLGTGSILSYARYISTKTGTKNRWSVVDLDSNMLWFDTMNRKIMRYSGQGLEILSDTKNISSFFRNLYPVIRQDTFYTGVHGVVDKKDNRVYFTFSNNDSGMIESVPIDDNTGTTISYNLLLGQFESLHSFAPRLFMDTELGLISTYNGNQGWIHGSDTYCSYYGNDFSWYIETIAGSTVKATWTNIEFNSVDQAPATVGFIDSYQTNEITDSSLVRRFRTYRGAIPRGTSDQRFVDYYIKAKLTYTSASSVIRLDDITLKYLIPII